VDRTDTASRIAKHQPEARGRLQVVGLSGLARLVHHFDQGDGQLTVRPVTRRRWSLSAIEIAVAFAFVALFGVAVIPVVRHALKSLIKLLP
jgi:hypothetical protein